MAPSKWLAPLAPDPGHGPVVLCIPYAGGGSMVFRPWKPLSDVATIIAVRPPGRENRVMEPPIPSVTALADALLVETAALFSRPLVIVGHSLGASVGFELARSARRRGLPAPRALIVSGRRAPHTQGERDPISHLPREQFLDEMKELAGTPPEFFEHHELVDLMLPALRADFAAAERYVATAEPPLDVPLVVYGGTDDESPTPEDLAAWAMHTTGAFSTHVFSGGHFFIHDHAQVLPVVRAELQRRFQP